MKNTAFLMMIMFMSLNIFPQAMQINWQQCYGGTLIEYTRDIVQIEEGYLVIGMTQSSDGDINSYHHGGADMWLIKTDQQGILLWEKCFGGSQGDGGARIFPDGDNGFYLLGMSDSSDGDISDDPYPGSQEYWIIKIDSVGNILWERMVGGNKLDQISSGTTTSDGGIVAIGWTNSTEGDVSIHYGFYDMWLVKLNSGGDIVWDKTFGNSDHDWGIEVIETRDKGFLVGGASRVAGGGNIICEPHSEYSEAMLVKLDSLGNIEWQQCYGGSDSEGAGGLLELDDGYVFVGEASSEDGDVTGWHPGWGHPYSDIWVVRVDTLGNLLWQKCLGGSYSESASVIKQTSTGDFMVVGITLSNDGDVSGNHSATRYNADIWMVKLSSGGELLWQQCIGGGGDERIVNGIIQLSDHRYVIAGQSDYSMDDVQCEIHHDNSGVYWPDFWVFEVYDSTVSIAEEPADVLLKVYPNPAGNYVIFELAGQSVNRGKLPAQIIISNALGRQVASITVHSEETFFDTHNIPVGMYFYKAVINGKPINGKLIIER